MSVGFKSGFNLPIYIAKNSWQWNAELYNDGSITHPDLSMQAASKNKILENVVDTKIVPILITLKYPVKQFKNFSFSTGLNFGEYIISQSVERRTTFIAPQNDGNIKAGEAFTYKNLEKTFFISPTYSFLLNFQYKLNNMGINLNFSSNYITPCNTITESTDSLPRDTQGTQRYETIKSGYEIGGLGYGFGVGVSYSFK